MTPADLIQQYIKLRDAVEARTKAFDAEMEPYKTGMTAIEGAMQEHLNANNLDNVKSEFGTAFKKTNTRVRVADRNSFNEFVAQQPNGLEYFTNAVSKEKIVDYVKEHGCAPSGVDVSYVTDVQFNRPRSS